MSVIGQNILGGASGQATGYTIDNSCRFNDNDSAYLKRTSVSAGNRKTWTVSFWVKRASVGGDQAFIAAKDGSEVCATRFTNAGTKLCLMNYTSSPNDNVLKTTAVYMDPAAWYHVVFAVDTSQATAADRCKLYVNGVEVTVMDEENYPTQNTDWQMGDSGDYFIGQYSDDTNWADYYLAEFHYVDGQQLTPASFAETDADTNEWKAKEYDGTYGTNGCFLEFKNSAALGTDTSGNGNNFTVYNLVATDQMPDTPSNNFCTMNSLSFNGLALMDGNLKCDGSGGGQETTGTMMPETGKWYYEFLLQTFDGGNEQFGITRTTAVIGSTYLQGVNYRTDGDKFVDGTSSAYGATWTTGDIIAAAVDLDANSITFYKNNVSQGALSYASGYDMTPMVRMGGGGDLVVFNFGQDSSFAAAKTAQGNSDGNGKGDFYYTPPAGYLALCSDNLADPSIALPGEHFNTLLWTGDASAEAVTGAGFEPDFIWCSGRSNINNKKVYDQLRGISYALRSNNTSAQSYDTNENLTSFDADGFTIKDPDYITNGYTFTAWNWKAGGAPTVDNSAGVGNTPTAGSVKINGANLGSALAGSIAATRLSANTTAGFSIIKYTGNITAGATVAHGLSQAPDLIIVKELTTIDAWMVYSSTLGNTHSLWLNTTSSKATHTTYWNDTSPNATVVTLGSDTKGNGTGALIMYAIHSVEGYSKIGSYEGNANANGPFIYTGFRPAMIITKNVDANNNWHLYDDKRLGYNRNNDASQLNENTIDQTDDDIDILSNGFKQRRNYSQNNANTYMFVAFAESPFKTARAR